MPGHYGHSKAAKMVAKKKRAMGTKPAGSKADYMRQVTLDLLKKKKKK